MGHGPALLLMEANGGFGVDSSPASIVRAGRLINFLTRRRRVGAAARQTIPSSNDIRQVSGIRRNSDLQIKKLFTERVAPRPGVADMFVEINDEQRRGWFLSYSVRLWRGRTGTVALPLVDVLQRSSHERCLVVLGQAFGVAERRDALLNRSACRSSASSRCPTCNDPARTHR